MSNETPPPVVWLENDGWFGPETDPSLATAGPYVNLEYLEQAGIVADTHEPRWRDHKTGQRQHKLSGADIQFPYESGCVYHRIEDIHKPEMEVVTPITKEILKQTKLTL